MVPVLPGAADLFRGTLRSREDLVAQSGRTAIGRAGRQASEADQTGSGIIPGP